MNNYVRSACSFIDRSCCLAQNVEKSIFKHCFTAYIIFYSILTLFSKIMLGVNGLTQPSLAQQRDGLGFRPKACWKAVFNTYRLVYKALACPL